MSPASTFRSDDGPSAPQPSYDPSPPTVAAFSPATLSGSSLTSRQRSTIIVHKKSPLLVATPPQITRALAYSHPFLLPLNKLVGLLSWSTPDPWESFLLVAGFWAVTLYGGDLIRYTGPILLVTFLILGMYSRRYSPLSSTTQTGEKHVKGHQRENSEGSRQQKSLDEIVEVLREFTTRCTLLLSPFLRLTDFLSTQRSPTSATTRPALTTLFIRILLVTPLWIFLTLPSVSILTPRRAILAVGTIVLTWHSRPARVSRVILWRSVAIRKLCSFLTGLTFTIPEPESLLPPALPPRKKSQVHLATEVATKRQPDSSGVRFTFILYENQRRWIGLGWTTSLFAYERGPWTDEYLNPAPAKDEFELPDVSGGHATWRWVDTESWRIEGGDSTRASASAKAGTSAAKMSKDVGEGGGGWWYYDSKWDDGRKEDGWGRYTRRRKWCRDAELVEATESPSPSPGMTTPVLLRSNVEKASGRPATIGTNSFGGDSAKDATSKDDSSGSVVKKRGWFGNRERSDSKSSNSKSAQWSGKSERSRDEPEDDHLDQWRTRTREADEDRNAYGLGEEAAMGLS